MLSMVDQVVPIKFALEIRGVHKTLIGPKCSIVCDEGRDHVNIIRPVLKREPHRTHVRESEESQESSGRIEVETRTTIVPAQFDEKSRRLYSAVPRSIEN